MMPLINAFFMLLAPISIPSLDKGKRGFDRRKCAHTSSSPLTIRQYSLRVFSRLNTFPLRQNCFAPDSDGFSSDFCFLRCRRAGARQGEKGKKRRKGALSGVSALIKRWYPKGLYPYCCLSPKPTNVSRMSRSGVLLDKLRQNHIYPLHKRKKQRIARALPRQISYTKYIAQPTENGYGRRSQNKKKRVSPVFTDKAEPASAAMALSSSVHSMPAKRHKIPVIGVQSPRGG